MSKRILVISPMPTHPRNAGHRERIYQMMRQIQALDHDVHLLYVTLEADGDIEAMQACWGERFHLFQYDIERTPFRCSPSFHATRAGKFLRQIGFRFGKTVNFPYAADDWYDEDLDREIRSLQDAHHFDIVILEYMFLSKVLLQYSDDVRKIIDTIDVFTNRHQRYKKQGETPVWFSTTRREEQKALRRADVLMTIQEHERRFFQRLVPAIQAVTVGHFSELQQLVRSGNERPALLFLASGNPINRHGLRYFITEVLPLIHKALKGTRLLVAGSICRDLDDDPAYTKLGEVEETKSAYAMADVVVSPILFGTGLKIKNLEALGYGKPLVTTPTGAQGMEDGQGRAFFCAETPDNFAGHVLALLSDGALRDRIGANAYQYAQEVRLRDTTALQKILECAE